MPLRHGQKFYCQLLLDQHRYMLVDEMAKQQGKRTTSLLREMVYSALEKALPLSEYRAAEAFFFWAGVRCRGHLEPP